MQTKNNNSGERMYVVHILSKHFKDGTLIDTVYDPDTETGKFAIYQPGVAGSVVDYFDKNGVRYLPLIDDVVKKGRILLPQEVCAGQDPSELLSDVRKVISKYVELEPAFEDLSAHFVLMTWVAHRFEKVPYLRIIGAWGTGKSRFLDVMFELCYHGSRLGGAVTPANIYRWIEKYGSCLLLDEADFEVSDKSSVIAQVLNSGYHRDGLVTRSLVGTNDYETKAYSTFGPKIVACRQPYHDDALESRFITQIAKRMTRSEDIPRSLPEKFDWLEMTNLRNRLLGFRVENFHKINPNLRVHGLENYEPRLAEILTPLFQVVNETKLPETTKAFIDQSNEDRAAELGMSDEGMVACAILTMLSKLDKNIFIKDIAEEANKHRNGLYTLSDRKVGEIIKGLGIRKVRMGAGICIRISPAQEQQLVKRYWYTS